MSMIYKVYLFDYDAFVEELADILFKSLKKNQIEHLKSFIEKNFNVIQHPYNGGSLKISWEAEFDTNSVRQLGDIALTKFYDPGDWETVTYWMGFISQLEKIKENLVAMVLGDPFGPEENLFDPGLMGSYFLSPSVVKTNQIAIQNTLSSKRQEFDTEYLEDLEVILGMFKKAQEANKGIYTTF